jgi:GntR family transcriptional regulator/MocR family aminotransferase
VLRRSGGSLLGYREPEGHIRLRRAIAQMLRGTRALAVSSDNVFITRGSQMAIALASRAFLRAGDTVAVEEPGYRYAWDIFRQSGAELAAIPVDDDGLDVEALARLVRRTSVRAVYVRPHHQLRTTVTMKPARRRALLDLAHAEGFVIIEDDFDHEFTTTLGRARRWRASTRESCSTSARCPRCWPRVFAWATWRRLRR